MDPFSSLDAEFSQVERDLQHAAARLSTVFPSRPTPSCDGERSEEGENSSDNGCDIDPVDLLRRLHELETALPALMAQLAAIRTEKSKALRTLAVCLPQAQRAAQQLAQSFHVDVDPSAATAGGDFAALVPGATAQTHVPTTVTTETKSDDEEGHGSGGGAAPPSRRGVACQSSQRAAPPNLPPARQKANTGASKGSGVRRRQRPTAPQASSKQNARPKARKRPQVAVVKQECTEEAFKAVPSLIRGRSKFRDVEKVYGLVVEYAQKELKEIREAAGNARRRAAVKLSDIPPLTIKKLSGLGGKVTGHTGDCVVKSLRNMGLITISKAGISLPSE